MQHRAGNGGPTSGRESPDGAGGEPTVDGQLVEKLRQVYDPITEEPLPQNLVDLLDQLAEKQNEN